MPPRTTKSKNRPKTTAPAADKAVRRDDFMPDAADRELATRAIRKRGQGQNLTRQEADALHRESVRRAVRAIPKKLWIEMSGRQIAELTRRKAELEETIEDLKKLHDESKAMLTAKE